MELSPALSKTQANRAFILFAELNPAQDTAAEGLEFDNIYKRVEGQRISLVATCCGTAATECGHETVLYNVTRS